MHMVSEKSGLHHFAAHAMTVWKCAGMSIIEAASQGEHLIFAVVKAWHMGALTLRLACRRSIHCQWSKGWPGWRHKSP